MTEAEKLLKKADNEFQKKNFEEAQKVAEDAEQIAKETFDKEKNKYLKKGIKESLVNINFMFNELDDLEVDISAIKKLSNEAQAKFDEGDYETAEKLLKESGFADIVINYYKAYWFPVKGHIVPRGMLVNANKK